MRFEEVGLNNPTDDEDEVKFATDLSVVSHGPQMNSFHFFKNQEIPQFFYDMDKEVFLSAQSSQSVWDDYADFKIDVCDNGDDKVIVRGKYAWILN